jgi:hypothetical protein
MKIMKNFFSEMSVNIAFNNCLNKFLRIFYSSFPLEKFQYSHKQKLWLTSGIKVSCTHKRKLHLVSRSSNDTNVKEIFKKYCRILTSAIMAPKKLHCNKLLKNLTTRWNLCGILLTPLLIESLLII